MMKPHRSQPTQQHDEQARREQGGRDAQGPGYGQPRGGVYGQDQGSGSRQPQQLQGSQRGFDDGGSAGGYGSVREGAFGGRTSHEYGRSGQDPNLQDWRRGHPGGSLEGGGYGGNRPYHGVSGDAEYGPVDPALGHFQQGGVRGGFGAGDYGSSQGQWIQDQELPYVGSPSYSRTPQYRGMPLWSDVGRGRQGPKGYSRSDERLREVVCERLMQDQSLDVSEVSVNVSDGCVRLEGTVPERYMKHVIEDVADSCWGVKDIENHLRIRAPEPPSGAQAFASFEASPDRTAQETGASSGRSVSGQPEPGDSGGRESSSGESTGQSRE